jgi:ribonuclease H2 subunit C
MDGADGKNVSYFRGRKLYGRGLKIPEGYRGVVLQSTERVLEPKGEQGEQGEQGEEGEQGVEGEDEETAEPEIKVMEEIAEFEEIIVWGHETVVDETDGYVRGVGEWLSWCDSIHSYDDGDKEGEKK